MRPPIAAVSCAARGERDTVGGGVRDRLRARVAAPRMVWHTAAVRTSSRVIGLIALVLLVANGCHFADERVVMKAVDLGRGVDEQGGVTEPTRTFDARSTVYASITTEGVGSARLHVEWRSGGKPLNTEVREIHARGPARFAFEYAPPDGWPPGRALLIFFIDERDKHAAEFEVR